MKRENGRFSEVEHVVPGWFCLKITAYLPPFNVYVFSTGEIKRGVTTEEVLRGRGKADHDETGGGRRDEIYAGRQRVEDERVIKLVRRI